MVGQAGIHLFFMDRCLRFAMMAGIVLAGRAREPSRSLGDHRTRVVEVSMIARRLRCMASGLVVAALAVFLVAGSDARGQDKEDKLDLDKIPKAVMDALKAKFPKAEIHKWTKAKEGDDIIYDIEFKQEGRKCEADIKENGTYINYEKEIAAKDLPKAVSDAIRKRYPRAILKEVLEETEVKGKDEKLSAYEVVLVTADKKDVELRLSPEGKILEDSGGK